MTIALYFDEDSMDQRLLRALQARGIDVVSALDAGMIARSDADHLQYAADNGRVLVTFNVADFYRLHTEWMAVGKQHAGIALSQQQRYSVGEWLRRLCRLIAERTAEDLTNRVEFLSDWS